MGCPCIAVAWCGSLSSSNRGHPTGVSPAYAPELNPVEYIWGYRKQHELPNLCPKDFAQLGQAARQALGRMRRRPTLVESIWKQAELF